MSQIVLVGFRAEDHILDHMANRPIPRNLAQFESRENGAASLVSTL